MIFRRSKQKASTPAASALAQESRKPKSSAGPSILTSDVVLEGNLATNGELQIDGTLHGSVRASVCIIDANGVIHGQVVAEDVFVRGRVIGPICGVHVTVVAGGHVEGDVLNQSIAIENGAYIDGKIRRSEDPMGEWQQMWYGETGQMPYDEASQPVTEQPESYTTYGDTAKTFEEPFELPPPKDKAAE